MKIVAPIFLLCVWQSIATSLHVAYFPPLDAILLSFVSYITSGELVVDTISSGARFVVGVSVGVVIALLTGTAMVFSKTVNDLLIWCVAGLRALPTVAMLPIVVLIFGLNDYSIVVILAAGAIVPMLGATIDGMAIVVTQYRILAQCLELPFFVALRKVYLPGSMPWLLTGLDQSIVISFKVLIIAEMLGAVSGVGFRLSDSASMLAHSKMYAVLFYIGLLGMSSTWAYNFIRNRTLRWL